MAGNVAARFPIRFTGANRAMVALGLRPGQCHLDVTPSTLKVRMGWAFQASIPRSAIRSVRDDRDRVTGWGVHGWGGTWLVNGSSSGLVRIDVEPPARARAAGFPVRLSVLRVSVEDAAGLQAALA